MKKILAILLTLAMVFTFVACHSHKFGEWVVVKEATCLEDGLQERSCECGEVESEVIPKIDPVYSAENLVVNGMYIDDSFDDSSLNLVYLFYTLKASSSNLTAHQYLVDVVMNGSNSYEPAISKDYIPYYTDYYYSAYNEDVYVGTSLNVCQVYKIPKGEFSEEHVISLDCNDIDVSSIQFPTSAVKKLSGIGAIAKDLNPTVYQAKYQKEQDMMASVDAATERAVRNGLNDYYWTFYANPSSYKIEFSAPNNFYIQSGLGISNNGTYSVHKGCIVLYYPTNGKEIVLPFTCNADGSPAFDTNGSIMLPTLADEFVVDPDYDGRE